MGNRVSFPYLAYPRVVVSDHPTGKKNTSPHGRAIVDNVEPTVYMVAGYTGTGKDHLFRQVSDASIEWNWSVFALENSALTFPKRLTRVSFADALKTEVAAKYGFTLEEIETKKNKSDIVKGKMTMRELLIDDATKNRKNDPNYYTKIALAKINPKQSYMVTDWRFVNEYEQTLAFCRANTMRLITIRVFRSAVAIPSGVESENTLDPFCTNFVFLSGESITYERCAFIRQFSQYGYYTELEF